MSRPSYRRKFLHLRIPGATYFVTWTLHRDQGWLFPPERDMIVSCFRFWERERYQLHGYVVMNDHVHAVVRPFYGWELEQILHSWKSYIVNRLQRQFHRAGPMWGETFERVVWDDRAMFYILRYIANNPRKRWSSMEQYPWVWTEGQPLP